MQKNHVDPHSLCNVMLLVHDWKKDYAFFYNLPKKQNMRFKSSFTSCKLKMNTWSRAGRCIRIIAHATPQITVIYYAYCIGYFHFQGIVLYTLPLIFMSIAYYFIVKTLWRRSNLPQSQVRCNKWPISLSHFESKGKLKHLRFNMSRLLKKWLMHKKTM